MPAEGRATVSVIIPAYNASLTLPACLEALQDTRYPGLEIIVVDDGSSDNTAEIAVRYGAKIIRTANAGSASAKNRGAAEAKGEYLYFLDSDVVVFPETIENCVTTLRNYGVDLVVGRYSRKPLNTGIVPLYKALADYVLYLPQKNRNRVALNHLLGGGGDFIKAEAFRKIGGFDSIYGGASVEREEFYIRFFSSGYQSAANPQIRTKHHFPGLSSLLKNYAKRIWLTTPLLKKKEATHFSYISLEKSILGPIAAFLAVLNLVLIPLFPNTYMGVFVWLLFYNILNREMIIELAHRARCRVFFLLNALHFAVSIWIALCGMAASARILFPWGK